VDLFRRAAIAGPQIGHVAGRPQYWSPGIAHLISQLNVVFVEHVQDGRRSSTERTNTKQYKHQLLELILSLDNAI
jgi:hypothetical protein